MPAASVTAQVIRSAGAQSVSLAENTRRLGRCDPPGLCLGRAATLCPRAPVARGFTLTELLVVIVIVGVLAVAALPRISTTRTFAETFGARILLVCGVQKMH